MARVLVITVAHPPGDARILHRQIAALREYGHEVTYAAPFTAFSVAPPQGIETIDLPRSQGAPWRRIGAVSRAVQLVRRRRRDFDAVLVHDPELLPALAAARAPGRGDRPVAVWDVHEDVPAQVSMLQLPELVKPVVSGVIHGAELLAERGFRLLLAERAYAERFRRRHPVVPNSVRVPAGGPWPVSEPPRVVYLGSLTWARGARELGELAESVPEIEFDVIGNAKADVGEYLAERAEVLPNLTYRGFVPNDQALALLPGALLGLSLLHDEPNYAHSEPTKVMEYMAHGLPTITTPNAASAQLVNSTTSGVVVAFGDVAAAAREIRRLTGDRIERDRLAANAYAAAAAHDWNRDGQEFAAVLDRWTSG